MSALTIIESIAVCCFMLYMLFWVAVAGLVFVLSVLNGIWTVVMMLLTGSDWDGDHTKY